MPVARPCASPHLSGDSRIADQAKRRVHSHARYLDALPGAEIEGANLLLPLALALRCAACLSALAMCSDLRGA